MKIKFMIPILLLLSQSAYGLTEEGMEFKIHSHQSANKFLWKQKYGELERIYATGKINSDTADKLEKFVKKNSIGGAIIYFNSAGGDLIGGLALGKLIRKLGFHTAVGSFNKDEHRYEGICASACAYAFAGGTYRYYFGKDEQLGLHQFSSVANKISTGDAQEISGLLVAYLQSMDVDALSFSISTKASPDEIIWLNPQDALKLNLSNNGDGLTTAEIKLSKNTPYLKIEQRHPEVIGRFLLHCEQNGIVMLGGIVTEPTITSQSIKSHTRSYLQFDESVIQERKDMKNVHATDSTVWVQRTLKNSDVSKLLKSSRISAWLGNEGYMDWGADVTITNDAKQKIRHFIDNCASN